MVSPALKSGCLCSALSWVFTYSNKRLIFVVFNCTFQHTLPLVNSGFKRVANIQINLLIPQKVPCNFLILQQLTAFLLFAQVFVPVVIGKYTDKCAFAQVLEWYTSTLEVRMP